MDKSNQNLLDRIFDQSPENKQHWRWLAIVPLSFFVAILGAFAVRLFLLFALRLEGYISESDWAYVYIIPTVQSFAFGILLILVAHYIAPHHKERASDVAFGVVICLLVTLFIITYSAHDEITGGLIFYTAGCLATGFGSFLACKMLHDDKKKN